MDCWICCQCHGPNLCALASEGCPTCPHARCANCADPKEQSWASKPRNSSEAKLITTKYSVAETVSSESKTSRVRSKRICDGYPPRSGSRRPLEAKRLILEVAEASTKSSEQSDRGRTMVPVGLGSDSHDDGYFMSQDESLNLAQQQPGPRHYPLRSRGMPATLDGSSRETQMDEFPSVRHSQSHVMPSYETHRRPRLLEKPTPINSPSLRVIPWITSGMVLKFFEPRLKPNRVRIRWQCRCGYKSYDDFTEIRPGAAKEYEHQLAQHSTDGEDSAVELKPG
ncbi:hypothetical protein MMC12_001155, partial [Toensbergia leucococca]|nr:hypothetical protein [Toensbergia leucococca]